MPLNHLTAFNLVKTISASTLTGSPLPYRLSSLGHPVNLRVLYCVCSIESGPCERVESLQMSGRF